MSNTTPAGQDAVGALRGEALRLCERAASRQLTVRISGSLAVLLHCPRSADLFAALGRRPPQDIDLIGYLKQQRGIEALFREEGWLLDPVIRLAQEWDVKRLIYRSPDGGFKVDVFLDQLVMSHTVDFRRRLELDAPTIPVVDLVLTKLQIHEISENDIVDLIVLLADHDLAGERPDMIDLGHLVSVLSDDWGFWYTARANLGRADEALIDAQIPADVKEVTRQRMRAIRAALDAAPKSWRWRLRAGVGTRLAWYQDVGEVERGEGL